VHIYATSTKGNPFGSHFLPDHGYEQEFEDRGRQHDDELQEDDEDSGVAKQKELVAELITFMSTEIHS